MSPTLRRLLPFARSIDRRLRPRGPAGGPGVRGRLREDGRSAVRRRTSLPLAPPLAHEMSLGSWTRFHFTAMISGGAGALHRWTTRKSHRTPWRASPARQCRVLERSLDRGASRQRRAQCGIRTWRRLRRTCTAGRPRRRRRWPSTRRMRARRPRAVPSTSGLPPRAAGTPAAAAS